MIYASALLFGLSLVALYLSHRNRLAARTLVEQAERLKESAVRILEESQAERLRAASTYVAVARLFGQADVRGTGRLPA